MLIGVLTGGIAGTVTGQDPAGTPDAQLQSYIEEMVRRRDASGDIAEITDYLQDLRRHPVDLNSATREELEKLFFLSDFQIAGLLEYRRQTGPLLSLSELQLVYGFDREMIRHIAPFVTLQEGNKDLAHRQPVRHELLMRVRLHTERAQGYRDAGNQQEKEAAGIYHGSPAGLLFRYALDAGGGFHAGLVGDKDPGEPMFRDINPQGFDFYSWYLQASPRRGVLRQINAGHYHLRFGQGLLLWNGFSINQPSAVLEGSRHAPKVRYASSSVENNYLQGLSLVLGKGAFSVTPFVSYVRRDARLLPADTLDPAHKVILSLPSSGLHRTPTEIGRKRSAGEYAGGMRVGYRRGNFTAAVNGLYTRWQYPLMPEEKPENLLLFRGKELFAGSVDYRFLIRRLSLFGEAALNDRGKGALLQGVRWYLSPLVTTSLLVRYYDPGYFSPYARSFSRSGRVSNEKGLLLGLLLRPAAGMTVTGSVDLWHSPWLRYGSDAPAGGTETRIALSWQPSEHISIYSLYRHGEREHNLLRPGGIMTPIIQQEKDHLRLQVTYSLTGQLQASNRLDLVSFDEGTGLSRDHGFFVCQDLQYHHDRIPFALVMRFGLFDTKYSTRVYTYENDLLYAFSTPSLTGRGLRWYFMGTYRLQRHLYAALRVARTSWSDRQTAGSGPEEVAVPHRTEIKAQIRMKF
jgi:hypothetical protein